MRACHRGSLEETILIVGQCTEHPLLCNRVGFTAGCCNINPGSIVRIPVLYIVVISSGHRYCGGIESRIMRCVAVAVSGGKDGDTTIHKTYLITVVIPACFSDEIIDRVEHSLFEYAGIGISPAALGNYSTVIGSVYIG